MWLTTSAVSTRPESLSWREGVERSKVFTFVQENCSSVKKAEDRESWRKDSNCTKKIFNIRGKCLLGKSKIYCKTNPELGGIGCSICVQFALHEEILSKLGFQNMKMESTN